MKKIFLAFIAIFITLQGTAALASNDKDNWDFFDRDRDYVTVPNVVRQYIFAWQHADGYLINALLTRDGGYSDYHPDNIKKPLRDKALVDYVKQFNRAQFIVTGINIPDEGKATIFWKIRWPNDATTISFRDELTLTDNDRRIVHVDSVSAPAPAAIIDLIDRFALGWIHLNGQEVLDTMTPDGIYYDGQNPNGINGQPLIDYVASMSYLIGGLQTNISLAKDHKVHGYWSYVLASTHEWVVDGMDIFVLRGNKIAQVNGYNLRWKQ